MPRLAGQREEYAVHAMRDFKSGKAIGRDTVIVGVLHRVSDLDLQDPGTYLANVK